MHVCIMRSKCRINRGGEDEAYDVSQNRTPGELTLADQKKYTVEGLQCMETCTSLIHLTVCLFPKEPSLKIDDVTYRSFDRVLVKIHVNKSSTENKFLSFRLISKKVFNY